MSAGVALRVVALVATTGLLGYAIGASKPYAFLLVAVVSFAISLALKATETDQ